ncbi:YbaK/EbsC family protein [Halosegnis sp.]|uniref:YbaK/EbsC family protein n=1 Tax=Halosegnis sp. TaxID=2864959 RepID=UPI0035D51075
MHPRAEEFRSRAKDQYGVDLSVEEFSEETRTAADAAEAIGCAVARIASSLVFLADGDPIVVVTSGANRVDEAKLADAMGVPATAVAMADPETVREATGWAIGGVPPICHDRPLPVYLDETLTDQSTVWAAAGTPEAVFPIAPAQLRELADATVADVAE